jgi:2-iminobutanoate/2-iminopropanoate deaminase
LNDKNDKNERIVIVSAKAPAAIGPYSQGIRKGGLVFCSGQLPVDSFGAMPKTIAEQTELSLKNLEAVLLEGGADLDTVLKTTVFLADLEDFAAMNAVYQTFFPRHPPARSTVEVARLPKDALIEIEAIATVR